MKAAIINDYNAPVLVTDVKKPVLLNDSVMVEVYAASVNPVDNYLRAGYLKAMLTLKFPYTLGYDIAGVVTEVGKGVSKFAIGDEVFARPNGMQAGTFAEFAVIKEVDLAKKPNNINFEEAASLPLVSLTAWQGLVQRAHIKDGDRVLIHAGSGGVGSIAIQIAKSFGAYVASTTSTANVGMVKSLGADLVIDYKTQKFEDLIKNYDIVLDTLGGETRTRSFPLLKKGGWLVSIVGELDKSGIAERLGVHQDAFFMVPNGEQLDEIAMLVEQGKITPLVDRTYSLDQIQGALDYVQTGRAKGKMVIKIK